MNSTAFEPRKELTAMLEGSDEAIDLIRAALCIAGEHNPQIDLGGSYQRIAKLVERARKQIELDEDVAEIATQLCTLLYKQVGFSGDSKNYYQADNSYLDRVLETRRGIPISLALVYIAVGEALGLNIRGVGFPGHFLLKLTGKQHSTDQAEPKEVLIDPFSGQVLSLDDCKEFLKVSSGNTLTFKPEYLNSIDKRAIVQRMLGNLKAIYINQGAYAEALNLCDRLLILNQASIQDRLDRAAVLEKLECYEPAAQDLEQVLKRAPNIQGSTAVQNKVAQLRGQVQGKPH